MKKVVLYGHPHSGSSLLLNLLSHSKDVNGIVNESQSIPPNLYQEDKINLCKWAMWSKKTKEPKNHIKIFIVREYKYSLSSLMKRFKHKVPKDHTFLMHNPIEYFSDYTERFLRASESKDEFGIRYKDLFYPDSLRMLFDFLEVEMPDDVYGQYERRITNDKIVEEHNPENHVDFRNYQLNMRVQNMNSPSNVIISSTLQTELTMIPGYSKVFQ